MELKNYFLIIIVIVAFALISVNFNDITGAATKDSAVIKVTPYSINSGGMITITVTPGINGVKNEVLIYKECKSTLMKNCIGNRMEIMHLCSDNSYTINCKEQNYKGPYIKEYKLPISFTPGSYYAKITEYKTNIERKADFQIN